jgi:CHAT domain
MADTLDLAILDAGPKNAAIIFARCGSDVAFASLPFGEELDALLAFRARIDRALKSTEPRPSTEELEKFGQQLFNYIIQGDVKELYLSLRKDDMVRLSILSTRADLKSIPWEFFLYPDESPGPLPMRPVVRIVPTRRGDPPQPLTLKTLGRKLKILFAFADPVDQDPVSWTFVRDAAIQELKLRLPVDSFELKDIDANPKELTEALMDDTYDIFHFSGHADVDDKGEGFLLLPNRVTNKNIRFSSKNLSTTLRQRGIRVAILSACNTSTGNFENKFDVAAEALVRSGIPAVVANQFPVPDSTVADFVKRLYKELLISGDIDRAVNAGRLMWFNDPALDQGKFAKLEWGIPTVYRHIAASQVFTP